MLIMKLKNQAFCTKNFSAFTLAEVLIVLGIIGVIAAITLSTLSKNYQKVQILSHFKKFYTEISQTMKQSEIVNGQAEYWSFTTSDITTTTTFADEYFYPFIKTLKKCEHSDNSCWATPKGLNGKESSYSLSAISYSLSCLLQDGSSLFFAVTGSTTTPSAFFIIDIDGPNKGRNMLGIDVFGLAFRTSGSATIKQGLAPSGLTSIPPMSRTDITSKSTAGACNKDATDNNSGLYCPALIILDGWQISSDYPL